MNNGKDNYKMLTYSESLTELRNKINSMKIPGIKGSLYKKHNNVYVPLTDDIIDKTKNCTIFSYRFDITDGRTDPIKLIRQNLQDIISKYLKEYDPVLDIKSGASMCVTFQNVHGQEFTVSIKKQDYQQPGTLTEMNFQNNIGEYIKSNIRNIVLTDGTKQFLIDDIDKIVNDSRVDTSGKPGEPPRKVDFKIISKDGTEKNISLKGEKYSDVEHVGSYKIEEFGFDKMFHKYITNFDCYVRPERKEKNTYVFRLSNGSINSPFVEFGNYTMENVFYGSCDVVVVVKKDGSLEDLGDVVINGKTYRKLKVLKLYVRKCDKKHNLGLKIRVSNGRLFGYVKNVYVDRTGKLIYDRKHTGGVNIRGLSSHIVSLENEKCIQKGVTV